eukprot:scaffold1564_cov174-Amphora_coffeaeformis.AAC.29
MERFVVRRLPCSLTTERVTGTLLSPPMDKLVKQVSTARTFAARDRGVLMRIKRETLSQSWTGVNNKYGKVLKNYCCKRGSSPSIGKASEEFLAYLSIHEEHHCA